MKSYLIVQIDVPRYPVVRLVFEDGLAGELDLRGYVDRGGTFEPLRDEAFFGHVDIGENGRSFGWRLHELYREIDFGADAARAEIETALVEERAERFRRRQAQAAE